MSVHKPLLVSIMALLGAITTDTLVGAETVSVYLGTYTRQGSQGIYLSELDLKTGKLSPPVLATETTNPSFLALHPTKPLVYAVGEMATFGGKKEGAVSAFARDMKTGKLQLLNQQSTKGPGPCHVIVDRTGQCVLVANYSGGSVACLPIQADGRLGEAASFVQHEGSGVDPRRQKGPHAHNVAIDAANRFAFVCDLGLDKVMIYRLDPAKAKITPNDPPSASTPPGAGPRHFAFHPNGRFGYSINELASTITAFKYDAEKGRLEPIETVSTLPPGYPNPSYTAEVVVHPSGKWLYGSNRGHDSIAVFAIDESGKLSLKALESTHGKNPRNFNLDPTASWCLAANQDSANVVVLRVDPQNGLLWPTGNQIEVSMPVCVKFLAK